MFFFCSIGLLKMVDRFYISLFKNGFFVLLHIYKDLLFIRIIKMDRQKQVERKKQIQSKIRYIEGQKKNGRRTAELKQLKKELVEINSIVDYSSSSNSSRSSKRGSSSSSSNSSSGSGSSSSSGSGSSSSINSSSSSSDSSINSYINTANDLDDDDFQDFFNNMEDPEVANLNKIQMLKDFYLFVIAKSKFLLFEIINNLY